MSKMWEESTRCSVIIRTRGPAKVSSGRHGSAQVCVCVGGGQQEVERDVEEFERERYSLQAFPVTFNSIGIKIR